MIKDLRYAIRALRRSPLFAVSAVVTLGIGIAVNTIMFTLLNSLALRQMPVRDADRVVRLYPLDVRGHRQNLFSYPDYLDYKAATALEGMTVRLVLAGGIRLLAAGLVIGLGGAMVAGRRLRQFLFDVSAVNPLTFLLVPAFLAGIAVAACYLPARRVSRILPLDALRSP